MQKRNSNRSVPLESHVKVKHTLIQQRLDFIYITYKISIHTSQRTKSVHNINTNLLLLLRERITVSCKNRNEHINNLFSHMRCYVLLQKLAHITNKEFEMCCKR